MTTIRVTQSVRDRLAAMAAAHDRSLGEELSALVDAMAWQVIAEGYRKLERGAAAMDDYRAQADDWTGAELEDLAAGAPDEYPEYNTRR